MQGLAFFVLMGWIKPTDQHTLADAIAQAITAVGALAAAAHVVSAYIHGRTALKAAAATAVASQA